MSLQNQMALHFNIMTLNLLRSIINKFNVRVCVRLRHNARVKLKNAQNGLKLILHMFQPILNISFKFRTYAYILAFLARRRNKNLKHDRT